MLAPQLCKNREGDPAKPGHAATTCWRHGVILLVRLFFVGCLLVEFGEDTMHKMRPDLGQSDLMVFYVVAYILCLRFNWKDQVDF